MLAGGSRSVRSALLKPQDDKVGRKRRQLRGMPSRRRPGRSVRASRVHVRESHDDGNSLSPTMTGTRHGLFSLLLRITSEELSGSTHHLSRRPPIGMHCMQREATRNTSSFLTAIRSCGVLTKSVDVTRSWYIFRTWKVSLSREDCYTL